MANDRPILVPDLLKVMAEALAAQTIQIHVLREFLIKSKLVSNQEMKDAIRSAHHTAFDTQVKVWEQKLIERLALERASPADQQRWWLERLWERSPDPQIGDDQTPPQ